MHSKFVLSALNMSLCWLRHSFSGLLNWWLCSGLYLPCTFTRSYSKTYTGWCSLGYVAGLACNIVLVLLVPATLLLGHEVPIVPEGGWYNCFLSTLVIIFRFLFTIHRDLSIRRAFCKGCRVVAGVVSTGPPTVMSLMDFDYCLVEASCCKQLAVSYSIQTARSKQTSLRRVSPNMQICPELLLTNLSSVEVLHEYNTKQSILQSQISVGQRLSDNFVKNKLSANQLQYMILHCLEGQQVLSFKNLDDILWSVLIDYFAGSVAYFLVLLS